MVTMGPAGVTKLSRKQKMLWTLGFFLEFFSQLISTTGSWDGPPVYLVTHGDHGTSRSDKIDQKTKNVVNTGFFLRIFFPTHFDHWKLRKSFWVGGWWWWKSDSSVISLVKESKLLTFSYLNESDLESTLTCLDQELDNIVFYSTKRINMVGFKNLRLSQMCATWD